MMKIIKSMFLLAIVLATITKAFAQADLKLEATLSPDTTLISTTDTLLIRYELFNTGTTNATGVKVKVTIPALFNIVSTSPIAGTSFNTTTGMWDVGTVSNDPNPKVLLIRFVKPVSGISTIEAEVSQMTGGGPDPDSTPNNGGSVLEDDYQSFCISTPYEISPPQTLTVRLANGTTGIQWYKDGVAISGETSTTFVASQEGVYSFTSGLGGCPNGKCCPVKLTYLPVGSIGDFVWKDANDNGIQDLPAEKGVKGVIIQLLKASDSSVLATDTTDANGKYNFPYLASDNYKVKIVMSSLPDTCRISPKQDVNTGGGNDTNDSDFNPTTGESPVIVIDVTKTGIDKDNPTIDAALVVPCVKPAAGTDVVLCQGINTVDLKNAGTDEAWSKGHQPANTTANINASTGLVTGLSSPGDYYFILTYKANATCSDTVKVTVHAKPNAGTDMTGGAAICNSVATADLPDATNGEAWSQLGTTPKAVTINASTGLVTGMDAVGTYQFLLKNSTTHCADTVSIEVKNCLKGSLGDFIWKDLNDNGIQDQGEPGVKGVIVQLLNSGTNAVLASDTTDTNGIYSFTGLDSGNYKVKIVLSSLPDTCQITSKQDVATGGGNDTNDSDFNPTTGESPVIVINTLGAGIAKDNPTIDAALVVPCVKSSVALTATPVCSPDVQTYSITFSLTNQVGNVKVNKGTLTGSNPYTVTGIPSGAPVKITDSLSAVCKFDTLISGPNCNCNPPTPILITPSLTACIGDTFPTLKATVFGLATVEWFSQLTGGTPVANGLSFKPSALVTAAGAIFYAQARSTDPTCPTAISTARVAATINAQNCTVEVDLALKKSISTKIAHIGDTLTYTIKVFNQFNTAATGVEVTDSIAATVQFIAGSFSASRGSAVISGGVIKWTIGNIAANGDTVTLTYKVKATQEGVHFNTAEISKTNEKDRDSTPGNGKDEEDDLDRQCFTVPVKLCSGEKAEVNIPAKYTNVQWFKNGGTTPVATGNQVLFSEMGQYTFTADNNTCPAEGCCPVIIEPGDNCCPEVICVPFTIKQTKKAGKKI